ncbi:Rpn family recombination-promoting nuclease/putative transposase [Bacillus mexicanus]|uniref:Rpn family recombination-promoting nuclease/putative transposase n=1 Tax=Bacillus mexicanus TaxID=2834415 RepID=UPI003D246CB0
MTRIDPLIDVAFKMIFSEEELLKSFLNSFLDFKIEHLESIFQESPTNKETIDEKQSYLDLKAFTDDGKIINIEVQLRKQSFFPKRSIYYTSKNITSDLKIKERYSRIPKVIAINILDFVLFNSHSAFNTHFVSYERKHNIVLEDAPEYHFIEMPKISKEKLSLEEEFHQWLLFLRPDKQENLYREVLKVNEDIKKAEERIKQIQNTPELKAEYDARFKQLTDEANKIETAKDEGREEGREEERKKMVKILNDLGLSLEQIEEKVGFNPKKYL